MGWIGVAAHIFLSLLAAPRALYDASEMRAPLIAILLVGASTHAHAQDQDQDQDHDNEALPAVTASDSALDRAEAAYLNIDFEAVRQAAQQALEEGGHDWREVVRIYQLLGMSDAALGNADAARDEFVHMLMLDSSAEVTELSPELRSPYLEARGRVGALSRRFGVETSLSRPQSAIIVKLTDPTRLASRVVVRSRVAGEGEFQVLEEPAAPQVVQHLDHLSDEGWAEYSLEVLDEHGNRLAAIGDAASPEIIGEAIRHVRDEHGSSVFASPWFWVATVAVLAGAGVGAYFLFFNEPTWNGQSGICSGCSF